MTPSPPRATRARRRDETPGGVRFDSGTTAGVSGGGAALLELVIPRLARKNDAKKNKNSQTIALSAHATLEALYEALDRARARSAHLAEEIGALAPYARALAAAGASTDFSYVSRSRFVADHASVKQGGFALIDEIALGKTTPQCCICARRARADHHALHAPACARCVVTWFHAAPMHGAAAAAGGAPCPLCRKPFHIEDLIRVMPNEEASRERRSPRGRDASSDGDDDASLSAGGRSGKGDERKGKGTNRRASSRDGEDETPPTKRLQSSLGGDPRVVRAAAVAARRGPRRPPRRAVPRASGRRPLPRARTARMRQSPKIAALVADLRERPPGRAPGKAVCSQLRDALVCAAEALTWEGVERAVDGTRRHPRRARRFARRKGSFAPRTRRRARWRAPRRPACRVLLLHAARRRRLDADDADLVIPREPFLSPRRGASREPRAPHRADARCGAHVLRAGHGRGAAAGVPDEAGGVGGEVAPRRRRRRRRRRGGRRRGGRGRRPRRRRVIRDAGDVRRMSRAQFDRMRFIFGLSDRGEASGGANESDDEREGREMPR